MISTDTKKTNVIEIITTIRMKKKVVMKMISGREWIISAEMKPNYTTRQSIKTLNLKKLMISTLLRKIQIKIVASLLTKRSTFLTLVKIISSKPFRKLWNIKKAKT